LPVSLTRFYRTSAHYQVLVWFKVIKNNNTSLPVSR